MASACEIRETFYHLCSVAGDQLGNHIVMQSRKKCAVSREIAAIEQRYRELRVFRIEAATFRQRACGGAKLEPQIPKFLREFADRVLEFRFRAVSSVQKQHVDIGIRKKPAASKTAQRDRCKVRGTVGFGADILFPQALHDAFEERGASQKSSAAIACLDKSFLDARRFLCGKIAQFSRERWGCVHSSQNSKSLGTFPFDS